MYFCTFLFYKDSRENLSPSPTMCIYAPNQSHIYKTLVNNMQHIRTLILLNVLECLVENSK